MRHMLKTAWLIIFNALAEAITCVSTLCNKVHSLYKTSITHALSSFISDNGPL
jgi:hypothetical protein